MRAEILESSKILNLSCDKFTISHGAGGGGGGGKGLKDRDVDV